MHLPNVVNDAQELIESLPISNANYRPYVTFCTDIEQAAQKYRANMPFPPLTQETNQLSYPE
jgi:hypothetical protein